jgi:hypothetical protein
MKPKRSSLHPKLKNVRGLHADYATHNPDCLWVGGCKVSITRAL